MLNETPGRISDLITGWHKEIGFGGGHGYYTSILNGTKSEHIEAFVNAIKSLRFEVSYKGDVTPG
jgi:hypothetical protein